MFVFGVRHYSPNTIHQHYSPARSALNMRCGLFGTKFGSLFGCMSCLDCMCACVSVIEPKMAKANGWVENSVELESSCT